MSHEIVNAMTVDVEDYFQVSAFEPYIARAEWDSIPCRVEANVRRIIELFERYGVRATFFTLGWIAERYPAMVHEMVAHGHEVASHGYSHVRVTQQTPEEFYQDVVRTKNLLEDISGKPVLGYRAASYSINRGNVWAWDKLQEAGYGYSSSIYPIRHDLYGMPDAPRFPFQSGALLEIPVTTVEVMGHNLPCGGGGYFRLLPYRASSWAIRRVHRRDRKPVTFYFHPWEIDPDQPRPRGLDTRTRFRHYVNLRHTSSRLERLLQEFSWGRMDHVYLSAGRS